MDLHLAMPLCPNDPNRYTFWSFAPGKGSLGGRFEGEVPDKWWRVTIVTMARNVDEGCNRGWSQVALIFMPLDQQETCWGISLSTLKDVMRRRPPIKGITSQNIMGLKSCGNLEVVMEAEL